MIETNMGWRTVRVNGRRLRKSLEEMAKIGATPGGGVERLALSPQDKQARDLLVQWLEEIGCEIAVDEMGSIFGKRLGRNPELPPVLTGSHVDSQPKGGRFDGILGVMGALEAVRTLHENGIETERSVVVVDWTNEEGSRFAPAMMASGVWAGELARDWTYDRTDKDGKRFGDELEAIGYKGPLAAKSWPFHAYFEYHIEQGPILEREGKTIGVPKGILCLHWYDVYLEGKANQVGPTPMAGRNDALVAAAEMILRVNELPAKVGGDLVATVGQIDNQPNSRNTIPDRVHFTVDIRSWNDELACRGWDSLVNDFTVLAQKQGCAIRLEQAWRVKHNPFDEGLVAQVRETAEDLGYSTHDMVSGAGHDASYLAIVGPAAMIFVPSIGGRSHVEVENTTWADVEAGANVLLQCVLKSANDAAPAKPAPRVGEAQVKSCKSRRSKA